MKNVFTNILTNRGFTRGASGRWVSPDAKQNCAGVIVEVRGTKAIAAWPGGRSMYDSEVPKQMALFLAEVY